MRGFLLFLLLFFTTHLKSAVITQSQVFSGTPNFSETLTFDKFNGPGNLTDIIVTISVDANLGQYAVDNDSNDPGIFETEYGLNGSVVSTDVAFLNSGFAPIFSGLNVNNNNVALLTGNDGDGPNFDAGGPDHILYPSTNVSDSDSGEIGNFIFFMFEGPDTFDVDVAFSQYLDFNGVGGLRGSFSPSSVSGILTVEYHTDHHVMDSPVFWVFFGGLLFIVSLHYRINRKSKVYGEEQ